MESVVSEIADRTAEEDRRDALLSIEKLLRIIPECASIGPGGRCKHELLCLRQEILEGKLQLPVGKRTLGTVRHIFVQGLLADLPEFDQQCNALLTILDYGLVRPRHYPMIATMIEDAIKEVCLDDLSARARTSIEELSRVRMQLLEGCLNLPLQQEDWRGIHNTRWSQEAISDKMSSKLTAVHWTLTTGCRIDSLGKDSQIQRYPAGYNHNSPHEHSASA